MALLFDLAPNPPQAPKDAEEESQAVGLLEDLPERLAAEGRMTAAEACAPGKSHRISHRIACVSICTLPQSFSRATFGALPRPRRQCASPTCRGR